MAKYNIKGARNQDLIEARAQLKQFRHDVSQLKKKGLLDKKYDARSITPTKYLKSVLKEFSNVLKGEAQPVKVSREKKKYYAEKGYATKGQRVIVPTAKNERAYAVKNIIRVKTTGSNGSITKIPLELDRTKINQWKEILKKKNVKLKEGEQLTFQLFGNNSHRSFQNINQMIEYLEYYPSLPDDDHPDALAEYIDNVVIFKIERNAGRPAPHPAVRERAADYSRRRAERYEHKLNSMTDAQEKNYHKERAAKEKARRDKEKIYGDPTKILIKKERAKERAKAWRAKQK